MREQFESTRFRVAPAGSPPCPHGLVDGVRQLLQCQTQIIDKQKYMPAGDGFTPIGCSTFKRLAI